ncbi:MAG: TraB/GumN family protein [Spirochaetales bacterium]|nr:TraB/GumN family protein [Spirochaetales bacterium]
MKKYIFFLLILFIFLSSGFTQDKNKIDFTYYNDSLGIGVSFPETWELYTSKENADDFFKDQFKANKSKDESPLFIGTKIPQKTVFVRCLTEKTGSAVLDYFQLLYSMNSRGIEVLEAKYIEKKDTVFWKFQTVVNDLSLQFIEILTIKKKNAFRVGFWTYTQLYPMYEEEFQKIIQGIQFKDGNKWVADWNQLFSLVPENNIDFVKLKGVEKQDTASEKSKGICYKIKGKKNNIYLLGSIHIGKREMYPLADAIENAFTASKYLAVEINAGDKETSNTLLLKATLPDNKTIDKVISGSLYSRLKSKIEDFGLQIDYFKQYKAWFFASILTVYNLMSLGYLPEYGVDLYFLNKNATAEKLKSIVELETIAQQVNTMESIDQETFLSFTLLGLEASKQEVEDIILAWKTCDIKKMEKIIFKDSYNSLPYINNLYDTLYYKRNIKMAEKITTYLEDTGDYFIILGAGHLLGEKSILKILEKKGYKPELFF